MSKAIEKLAREEERAWELWLKNWTLAQKSWRRYVRATAALTRATNKKMDRDLAGAMTSMVLSEWPKKKEI